MLALPDMLSSDDEFSSEYEDLLLHVSADGTVLREISFLQALIDHGGWYLLYDRPKVSPTHVNDIELVTPALARRISGVEPGDLLLSARHLDALAIVSRRNGGILWLQVGPWIQQHDPDIMPNGTISVFNNDLKSLGGSSIIEFDPRTEESMTRFPDGHVLPARFLDGHDAGHRSRSRAVQGRPLSSLPEQGPAARGYRAAGRRAAVAPARGREVCGTSSGQRVRMLVITRMETIARYGGSSTVIWQERPFINRADFADIARKAEAYRTGVRRFIEDGVESGEIRPDVDPHLLMLAIDGITGWAYLWYRSKGAQSPREIGEAFWAYLAQGVLSAPPTRPAKTARPRPRAGVPAFRLSASDARVRTQPPGSCSAHRSGLPLEP